MQARLIAATGRFVDGITDRKKELAIKLTRLMNEEVSLIMAHGLKTDDFNIVKRNCPEVDMTTYDLCAEQCLAGVTNWTQSPKRIPPSAVYFEAGHHLEAEASNTYED